MMKKVVEMTDCDRPAHGLAVLAYFMHHPLTALGKLAAVTPWHMPNAIPGEFPTIPQPRIQVAIFLMLTEFKPMTYIKNDWGLVSKTEPAL